MLDLRRLRLLRELHARGTIAAVAAALQYTPSAVSQQLAVLEREAGRPLLQRVGRGVRLTDDALILVGHAEALLDRAERAEAELAAGAGRVAGRARIASFQSMALRLAVPAMQHLTVEAPELRCELVEAEPEQSLPALALGDVDLVLADEWQHSHGRGRPASSARTSAATPSRWRCPPTTRPRCVIATPSHWPSWPTPRGSPAIPTPAGTR